MNEMYIFLPAITGSVLISLIMGVLGIFIVWRRMVFVALALSQAAGIGTIMGYILRLNPEICAATMALAGAGVINIRFKDKILHKDNLNALVYVLSSAASFFLLVIHPSIEWSPEKLFGGNLLYLVAEDLKSISILCIIFLILVLKLKNDWIRLIVNEQEGIYKKTGQEILFFVIITTYIALASRWAGLLFCFGSLLFPALFVNLIAAKVKHTILIAIVYSSFCSILGVYLGLKFDLPLGIVIILIMGGGVFILKTIKLIKVSRKYKILDNMSNHY